MIVFFEKPKINMTDNTNPVRCISLAMYQIAVGFNLKFYKFARKFREKCVDRHRSEFGREAVPSSLGWPSQGDDLNCMLITTTSPTLNLLEMFAEN